MVKKWRIRRVQNMIITPHPEDEFWFGDMYAQESLDVETIFPDILASWRELQDIDDEEVEVRDWQYPRKCHVCGCILEQFALRSDDMVISLSPCEHKWELNTWVV